MLELVCPFRAYWLSQHPGGAFLFSQTIHVERSKTKRTEPTPITRDEAHDHFQRTLAGNKWQVLKGWHTLRHSFASNLAARGVDQRVIDKFMGHQTDEQRRRYRHLFPNQQRQAICAVFDLNTADSVVHQHLDGQNLRDRSLRIVPIRW